MKVEYILKETQKTQHFIYGRRREKKQFIVVKNE